MSAHTFYTHTHTHTLPADICISCGSVSVSLGHPLFSGGMCQSCKVRRRARPLKPPAEAPDLFHLVSFFCRTASWNVRTSTTMTATSRTAPSAAEAGRCSCVETTTAVGEAVVLSKLRRRLHSVLLRSFNGSWAASIPMVSLN